MMWRFTDDTENANPICNFRPEVLAVICVYTDMKSDPIPSVKIRLSFDEIRGEPFIEPITNLDDIKWSEKDIRCRFHPEFPKNKAQRYLADYIRAALPNAPTEKVYSIRQLGTHIINGSVVFCTGGELICSSAGQKTTPDIQLDTMPYNLDIDPTLSEQEAAIGILDYISLYPNAGRIELAHTLLYLQRQAYEQVWKSPCVIIFVYGKTGTKKTTTAAFISQVYNRSKGITSPIRFNSSLSATAKILSEMRDCTMVLDDLFPANDREMKRKQEQLLYEITRIIGDGVMPARISGKCLMKDLPACGVIFTGEYLIGTGSDAARLLPVEMTPLDGKKLKQFQDNPLIVSTFYFYYIKWYIENYDEICELLKQWLKVYREIHLGVHARLQETHFFLNTAYALLLQYLSEISVISEQNSVDLYHSFSQLLTRLLKEQQMRVEQGKNDENRAVDFLATIRSSYLKGAFRLANNAKQFRDGYDGLIHQNYLCLRGETIRKMFLHYQMRDVAVALDECGALKKANGKNTIQIYGTGGKRFYAMPLSKLKE